MDAPPHVAFLGKAREVGPTVGRKADEEWRKTAERKAAESFGTWLADRRGSHITQRQLADRAGLSAALVSNVEAGRRRATNNYLRSISEPLKHEAGEWHLREIRDRLHAEILLSAVVEHCADVAKEAGGIDESPEALALLVEAQALGERVDESNYIIGAYLAAVGRDDRENFDPEMVRKEDATDEDRGTTLRQQVESRLALQSRPGRIHPGPIYDESQGERNDLLNELFREVERLSTPQLHRVLGFVAALPRVHRST
jgi:transcriptional regulator with XRE-family HTH domain